MRKVFCAFSRFLVSGACLLACTTALAQSAYLSIQPTTGAESGFLGGQARVASPEDIFKTTTWCADPDCHKLGLTRNEYVLSAPERLYSTIDRTLDQTHGSWLFEETKTPRRIEWVGYFLPKTSGSYRIVASGDRSDRYQVEVNGKVILDGKTGKAGVTRSAPIPLLGGKSIQIIFNYFPGLNGSKASLGVVQEAMPVQPESTHLVKISKPD